MDLFVAQPPVNHSVTLKPLDYKNNGSYTTVIKLLSKDLLKRRKPALLLGFYDLSTYSNSSLMNEIYMFFFVKTISLSFLLPYLFYLSFARKFFVLKLYSLNN